MASKVIRVTMFKIPSTDYQSKFIEFYKTLSSTAVKDGKPYILSLEAGPLYSDERSQGFTFAAKSEFATKADMDFYDFECPAHAALKGKAKDLKDGIEGMMTIYYSPAVTAAL